MAIPAGFEGNLRRIARARPEFANTLGIVIHVDGSVTYPDAAGLNARLSRAGFPFLFDSVQGEISVVDFVKALGSEIPHLPMSRSGSHQLHDLAVHALGCAALPKRVMNALRDRARQLTALWENASDDTERQVAEDDIERFAFSIDTWTEQLTDRLSRPDSRMSTSSVSDVQNQAYRNLLVAATGTAVRLSDFELAEMRTEVNARLGIR